VIVGERINEEHKRILDILINKKKVSTAKLLAYNFDY
jgi:hypothetical protein